MISSRPTIGWKCCWKSHTHTDWLVPTLERQFSSLAIIVSAQQRLSSLR